MTAIPINWPHSCAVIFENTSDERIECPFLGRAGVNFRPGDKVALIGNALTQPNHFNRYNGKTSIKTLVEVLADGKLVVLSIPGGTNEKDNTSVPMIDDTTGELLPNCRLEW